MPKDTVFSFWGEVERDPALLAKMQSISSDDAEGVISFAKELGFSIAWEDLWQLPSHPDAAKKDLSDESLDSVSGGKCCGSCSSCS